MTISQYISEIRQALPLDWPNLDDRMILRLMDQFRTVYIKNQYNKNGSIDRFLTQTIVIAVSPATQSTIEYINSKDRILKSHQSIPKIIKSSHTDLITSIRNANILSKNYNYVDYADAIFAGNGKFNSKDIFVFINRDMDDFLYVKLQRNNPAINMLTHISLQAIFESPIDCIPLQYGDDYVDFRDYEYPMTDTVWGYIKSNILQDGLRIIQSDTADDKERNL